MLRYNEYILENKSKKNLPEIIQITKKGNNSVLIKFLKNNPTSINDTDDEGNTALILACEKDLIFIVDTLLKNNADVNLSNNDGDTPLMVASTQKIIDMLLNVSNIDINKINNNKETALNKCRTNNYKFKKLLNLENIDITIKNKWGYTILMYIINDSHISEDEKYEILKKMIDIGLSSKDEEFYNSWRLKNQVNKYNL